MGGRQHFRRSQAAAKGLAALPHVGARFPGRLGRADARPSRSGTRFPRARRRRRVSPPYRTVALLSAGLLLSLLSFLSLKSLSLSSLKSLSSQPRGHHRQPSPRERRRRRVSPPYRMVALLSAGLLLSLLSFLSIESLSLSSLKSLSSQPRGHHRQPSPTGMTARTEPRPPVRFLTGTKAECPENP